MVRCLHGRAVSVTLLCCFALMHSAYASGPTGEDEVIQGFTSGLYPLELSGDGHWRFHTDEQRQLHRVALHGDDAEQAMVLPEIARTLSASQDGNTLAFSTFSGCIGVVHYQVETALKDVAWYDYDEKEGHYQRDYCLNSANMAEEKPSQGSYGMATPIALSRDGKRLAIARPHPQGVVVLDLQTRAVVERLPGDLDESLKYPFRIQWVDQDRKLLVYKMMLGEGYESPSEGSNVQVTLYDVISKQPLRQFETDIVGSLPYYQLLWHVRADSSTVWYLDTRNQPERPDVRFERPDVMSVALDGCVPAVQQRLQSKDRYWIDFVADPSGRWVAVVEADDEYAHANAGLAVYAVEDGRLLASWPLPYNGPVRALQASDNGEWLYATTSGQATSIGNYDAHYVNGGQVMTFSLARFTKDLKPLPKTAWPTQACQEIPPTLDTDNNPAWGVLPVEVLREEGLYMPNDVAPPVAGWQALICSQKNCRLEAVELFVRKRLSNALVKPVHAPQLHANEKIMALLRGNGIVDGKALPTWATEADASGILTDKGSLATAFATPDGRQFNLVPRQVENADHTASQAVTEEGESEQSDAESRKVNLYLEGSQQRQLLSVLDQQFLESMMSDRSPQPLLVWAGDADGDGQPDLITRDPRGSYSVSVMHWWLSSLRDTKSTSLVGEAAVLDPAMPEEEGL